MFDIGGFEILILVIVSLVVLKPEDLPDAMYKLGKFFRKIRRISREFYNLFEDIIYEDEKKIDIDIEQNNHKDLKE